MNHIHPTWEERCCPMCGVAFRPRRNQRCCSNVCLANYRARKVKPRRHSPEHDRLAKLLKKAQIGT